LIESAPCSCWRRSLNNCIILDLLIRISESWQGKGWIETARVSLDSVVAVFVSALAEMRHQNVSRLRAICIRFWSLALRFLDYRSGGCSLSIF